MSDLAVLFLHLVATLIRLVGPGGARAVVAESVLLRSLLKNPPQGIDRSFVAYYYGFHARRRPRA